MAVLFVGGAHVDVTGRLDSAPVMAASNPGRIVQRPGGAGINMASNAAVLGAEASLVGPIGADALGAAIRAALGERGIGDRLYEVPGAATGTYTAIVAPDGAMVIGLADLALYDRLTAGELFARAGPAFADAETWALNANLAAGALAEIAARRGDFGPRRVLAAATISPAKAPRLKPILPGLDLLFTSLREARSLLEGPLPDPPPGSLPGPMGVEGAGGARELARRLMAESVAAGVISAGAEPLTWWHGDTIGSFRPAPADTIADVNGAGDAVAGTILAALEGQGDFARHAVLQSAEEFARAVRLAMAAGRLTLACNEPFNPAVAWPLLEEMAQEIAPEIASEIASGADPA